MGVELPESAISVTGLVDKYIGTAYDHVVEVGAALPLIDSVADDLHYFVRTYYGPRSSFPATRPNGEPMKEGDLFYNTNDNAMYVLAETEWTVFTSTRTQTEVITVTPDHHTETDTVIPLTLRYMPNQNAVLVFQDGHMLLSQSVSPSGVYQETDNETLTFPGLLLPENTQITVLSVSAVSTVSPHISVQKEVYLTEVPYQSLIQLPHGMSYIRGNHNLEVYRDGKLQTAGVHYIETSDRTITFLDPVVAVNTPITFKKGNLLSNVELAVTGVSVNYPSQVTGLMGVGLLNVIQLHWDEALYSGHEHSEVWRSPDTDFANAVLLQTLPSYMYYLADTVEPATTYTYWVRFTNLIGEKGVFSDPLTISSAESPTALLTLLRNQISATQLTAGLNDRIDLIDMPELGLVDKLAKVDAKAVSILDLTLQPDSALALALDAIEVKADTGLARAADIVNLVVEPDSALATKFSGIDAKLVLPDGATTVAGAITQLNDVITGPEGAIASQIGNIGVTYGSNTVSLQQLASTVATNENTYAAQWSVKTDVNGITGGIGFLNDGVTTKLVISASELEVFHNTTRKPVFTIDGEGNTWLNSAMINDAYINNLVAEVISTNQLNTNDLHITGGSISYNNGAFAVDPLGNATASALTLTGGELDLGNGAFHVDNNGAVTASNLTVTGGNIDLTTDHFALTNPTTQQKDLYWDGDTGTLTLKGRLILQDGSPIQSIEDLQGAAGDTVYVEYEYAASATGPWHGIPTEGDAWIKTRTVTNGVAGTWSTAVRWQGVQGEQGIAGVDGTDHYTWIKYADDYLGNGLSDDPTDKAYIGIAYNKTTATESLVAGDYTWSRFLGATGVAGPAGANGLTTYTWIKYADDANGTGMSDSPTGKNYMGIAVNKTSLIESSTPSDYVWSLTKGDTGATGATGPTGPTGATGAQGYRGAGRYTNGTWIWPFGWDDGAANTAVGGTPVLYDVVTLYRWDTPSSQLTKMWNGSGWQDFALQIHGNALVDGTLVASKLVAGTITGDKIAAGAITASKIAISDMENLCYNGTGLTKDGWEEGIAGSIEAAGGAAGYWTWHGVASNNWLIFRCRDNFFGQWMNVKPGDQFYVSADTVTNNDGVAACYFGIGFCTRDYNGNINGWPTIGRSAGTQGYQHISGTVTIPANTASAKIFVQIDNTQGVIYTDPLSIFNVTNIEIRRKANGSLIVDGAITAAKLAAGTITGDKIAAGQTLSSPNISGGTLTLGSGNNMSFQEGGSAGFGKGGPYGAWGYGWNTIIYNDGGIYTNRLYASGGVFDNITINSSCTVNGAVNAQNINGVINRATYWNGSTLDGCFSYAVANPAGGDGQTITLGNVMIYRTITNPNNYACNFTVSGICFDVWGAAKVQIIFYTNEGVQIGSSRAVHVSYTGTLEDNTGFNYATVGPVSVTCSIPANTTYADIRVKISAYIPPNKKGGIKRVFPADNAGYMTQLTVQ